jgi:hypothetical protein
MIVRVRGIKRVRAKGRVYYYHRATGGRILSPPHSAAFVEEVRLLDVGQDPGRVAKTQLREPQHRSGTWGALVATYLDSPEFSRLADRTKRDYRRVLDYLAALDDMPLIQMTSAACLKIRDRAFTQRKRRFANYVIHMLSVVLGWGQTAGLCWRERSQWGSENRRTAGRPQAEPGMDGSRMPRRVGSSDRWAEGGDCARHVRRDAWRRCCPRWVVSL